MMRKGSVVIFGTVVLATVSPVAATAQYHHYNNDQQQVEINLDVLDDVAATPRGYDERTYPLVPPAPVVRAEPLPSSPPPAASLAPRVDLAPAAQYYPELRAPVAQPLPPAGAPPVPAATYAAPVTGPRILKPSAPVTAPAPEITRHVPPATTAYHMSPVIDQKADTRAPVKKQTAQKNAPASPVSKPDVKPPAPATARVFKPSAPPPPPERTAKQTAAPRVSARPEMPVDKPRPLFAAPEKLAVDTAAQQPAQPLPSLAGLSDAEVAAAPVTEEIDVTAEIAKPVSAPSPQPAVKHDIVWNEPVHAIQTVAPAAKALAAAPTVPAVPATPVEQEQVADLTAPPSFSPVPTLSDLSIVFTTQDGELDDNGRIKLDNIAGQMETTDGKLLVRAYASGQDGSKSSARRISLSRALAVRSYLMDKGIKPNRVDVRALGLETDKEPLDRVDLVFSR